MLQSSWWAYIAGKTHRHAYRTIVDLLKQGWKTRRLDPAKLSRYYQTVTHRRHDGRTSDHTSRSIYRQIASQPAHGQCLCHYECSPLRNRDLLVAYHAFCPVSLFPLILVALPHLPTTMPLCLETTLAILGLMASYAPVVGVTVRAMSKWRRLSSPLNLNDTYIWPRRADASVSAGLEVFDHAC